MVTGKILWFGGKNTKTGKINDFGYIAVDNQEEEVKVFRDDVPLELQNIFEKDKKKGKGYSVEFDIKDLREGKNLKKRAVNVKPVTKLGFFISLQEIITQDNTRFAVNSINLSNKGKIVEFIAKNNNASILRQVNIDEVPENVLRAFCNNDDYQIAKIFINQYFSIAQDADAIEYILNKVNFLNAHEISELFELIYSDYEHLFLISDKLRQQLKESSLAKYNQLIEENLWSVDEDTQINLWSEFTDIICSSNESSVIFTLLKLYLNHIEVQDAVGFISEKLSILEPSKIKDFLDKSFEYKQEAFLESESLHPYLRKYNFNQYLKVVQQILDSDNQVLNQSIVQDLIGFLSNCPDEQNSLVWAKITYFKSNLEYYGYLWDIAPLEYKQQVIKERYSEFFALVKEFENSSYLYSEYISSNCGDYKYFDSYDNKLVQEWMPCNVDSEKVNLEKARLISARGAEKLVKYFYEKTGNQVEDIAVHQVTKRSKDWIKGDIRINSSLLLDVKNARKSTNSDVYSEFCIPQFKQERGNDVLIAAVFSPYNFFDKDGDYYLRGDTSRYLGELQYNKLIDIISIFSDDSFEIDLSRGFDPNSYLPPWLFDYNDEFYVNQVELSKKLKKSNIPSYQDLKLLNSNLIYKYANVFIFGNYKIPESWIAKMSSWAVTFYKSLYRPNSLRLSLPYLYLVILKHFLQMLSIPQTEYHPKYYKVLLGSYLSNPCKLYDPLKIINSFCETLETLWEHRNAEKLKEFKVFKFNGQGFLQGKPSKEHRTYTTILAYCGGWTDGKGKCGYTPLVIGKHRVCEVCGKLICPKDDCEYCSRGCSGHEERKRRRQPRRRR